MSQTRQERVARLAGFLRLMHHRANEEVQAACFATFEVVGDEGLFIQFCFECCWFSVDLPQTTLSHEETRRLLRSRRRFFREAEQADAAITDTKDLVEFDPVCKKYIYGDEQEAAEDAAYVLFDLWGLPPDVKITVKAATFHEGPRWEYRTRWE